MKLIYELASVAQDEHYGHGAVISVYEDEVRQNAEYGEMVRVVIERPRAGSRYDPIFDVASDEFFPRSMLPALLANAKFVRKEGA
jgi:hypothetical protein